VLDAGEVRMGAEGGVGLIDHQQGPRFRADLCYVVDRRDVSVHREDEVGDHDDPLA
jgi:hypothetical protein